MAGADLIPPIFLSSLGLPPPPNILGAADNERLPPPAALAIILEGLVESDLCCCWLEEEVGILLGIEGLLGLGMSPLLPGTSRVFLEKVKVVGADEVGLKSL